MTTTETPEATRREPSSNAEKESFEEFFQRTSTDPVYVILGVQGSGTNLLARLLTAAFGFSVTLDRAIIFNEAARLPERPTPADIAKAFGALQRRVLPSVMTRKLRRHVMRDDGAFRGITEHFSQDLVAHGADLARFMYAYRAYSAGRRRIAVKSDDMWERIAALDRVIPNRRIILITRDFRDNIVSVCGKDFGPRDPLCCALYVKKRFARYRQEYERSSANALHVRFEEIVSNPRGVAERLADHFRLEPTTPLDAALSGFPIRPNKVRRWDGTLRPAALAQCEALLRDELETFGYQLTQPAAALPGKTTMAVARTKDVIARVPQKLGKLRRRLQR